jgi:SnoaL-like domain
MSEPSTTTLGPATPADWTVVPPPDDVQRLQHLLQMYGFYTDQGRAPELAGLFTADAVWDAQELGLGAATGPQAIAALVTGHFDPAHPMVHLPGPAVLTVVSPDEVHGVCWCMATRWTGSGTMPVIYFHYEDVFRRATGEWRFARRLLRRRFPNA